MNFRRYWYLYVIGLIVILLGAYFLFQRRNAGFPNTGSSLPSSLASSTILGKSGPVIVSTPSGGAGQFGMVFDTTNLHLTTSGTLPTIQLNLPPQSGGKVIVLALKPALATSTFASEILFGYILSTSTDATSTQIQGIKLDQYIDGATGKQHIPTVPGTYELEAVLWNRDPFFMNGVYGDFTNGNNATAVLSGTFTIAQ